MWQPKPSKGWVSNMFRMSKTLDVITLFHKPSISASTRVHNLLKQASAQAAQTATEDQASDHSHQNATVTRDPFELEINEGAPTPDQLKSIFQYLGGGVAGELVKGAASESDALRKVQSDGNAFIRPVVVDWARGQAVVGDKESEILKLLKEEKEK
ncbi:thioredoxin-like protein [Exophiala viscosa]|uniref:Thioredoxin-like protein n=1 Tax=Exophiala viscosa TaxID=2486360 RepID=A0AAN6E5F3_9EURO|nr:thioredoxin-like protein [Exophiala viscosa]